MRIPALPLLIALVVSWPTPVAAQAAQSTTASAIEAARPNTECVPPVIRDIRLAQEPVFGVTENANWLYRLGDKLHIDTRLRILRRELLFAPGDRVDPEALAQTERNLRGTQFIAEARVDVIPISVTPNHEAPVDGVAIEATTLGEKNALCTMLVGINEVDVLVSTRDSWSTSIEAGLRKADDRLLWAVALEESNLLGLGKTVRLEHRSDIDRDSNSLAYIDPRVGGTRNRLEAVIADQSDGARAFFQAGRPFFALDTAVAWNATVDSFDQIAPLWASGERVGGLQHVRRHVRFGTAWLVRRRGSSALRVHAGLAHRYDDVEVEVRSHDILELAVTQTQHRFIKLAYLNHERPEDVNLGADSRAQIGLGAARSNGDSRNAVFFDVAHRQGLRLGDRRFALGTASWNGRTEAGRLRNALLDVRAGLADGSRDRQLLIARVWYRHGTNLDPEVQLTLGSHNGLRGYPVNQFVGDRSLLLGVEYRRFLFDSVLRFVSLGVAAFVDSGYAWARGTPTRLGDLRTNAGIGLLVGRRSVSTGRAGMRFDLAYAFDPVPGRSQWVVSFGTATTLGF